jgi:hypothetical protein
MSGFFSDIRSLFDAKYSGRYLALMLRELGRREPELFARVFDLHPNVCKSIRKGEMKIECEWHFETKQGAKRRADLAVLEGGEPILLVEVKEDDVKSPRNPEQLADYLSMLSAAAASSDRQIRFVHVSRFSPISEDRAALQKAKNVGKSVDSLRYREIYEALQQDCGPIGYMLREYLEDIRVASYSAIDLAPEKHGKSLACLLTDMLGFPDRAGLGKLHSDTAISHVPDLFTILFGNLEVLADWVKEHNQNIFHTRFTRGFRPVPHFRLHALQKAIGDTKGTDGPDQLPGERGQYIQSGAVQFYAYGKISKTISNDWFYVEIGYAFDIATGTISKNKNQPVRPRLYADFVGRDFECYKPTNSLKRFPAETEALKKLHDCIKAARQQALATTRGPIREAFRNFKIPPM